MMVTWKKMAHLLKLGISKLKQVKSHTNILSITFLLILFGIPAFACTRSVSEPKELTQEAIRFELTKIARETEIPAEISAQMIVPIITHTKQPTAIVFDATEPSSDIQITQMQPTKNPEIVRIVPIQTLTPTAVVISSPVPRNTIPVELINPDVPIITPTEAVDILTQVTPTQTSINPDDLPPLEMVDKEKILYTTQNGDILEIIAHRFGTSISKITSIMPINTKGFLDPNIPLFIPYKNRSYLSGVKILPDEYIVFSNTASDYNIVQEIKKANGFLANYEEYTAEGLMQGSEIIYKVSRDFSINPIVLLSLLEYKSRWVYSNPKTTAEIDYPMGWIDSNHKGLYKQMTWAAGMLSTGFYGWRYGKFEEIPFFKNPKPGKPIYFEPSLNAGSVAIQYLFSQLYTWNEVEAAIYGENGYFSVFISLFGNVWEGYQQNPNGLNAHTSQIELSLPFSKFETWSMTGGPHAAWSTGSPAGAIDLAPSSSDHGCVESKSWIKAVAAGKVVRTSKGVVIVDSDGDGLEETGWVILYLHVATADRVAEGTIIPVGGNIGHPSCEGGAATGTHLHIARKFNGEWIPAFGPIPFVLSGWSVFEGENEYNGGMRRGNSVVIANPYGSQESLVRF
jgi:LasA protease